MSKIGKKLVVIPEGVKAQLSNDKLVISGQGGELTTLIPNGFSVVLQDNSIAVINENGNGATFGQVRANIANMVNGVSSGWTKTLEITGTGFRAATDGKVLTLSLGFSHPVIIEAPEGVSFQATQNKVTISGVDKMLVGTIAATIRKIRPADPYKGKGIRYEGQILRKKQGKAAKGVGGAA